ncbi:MAG: nucleoside deaminase [Acidimicrobiales bacterium]|jgi:tRNA(Arg) A34 adenosine deaminase TadA|nr:nucleoside deaminase [Acidimicrobiales bacterium]
MDPSSEPSPHLEHLRRAVVLARSTAEERAGGPFGAVVVRDGEVIGEGANRVVAERDPTWHAEVAAIRDACRRVGSHWLRGAVIYASNEPCPMCAAAIHWAHLDAVVYAGSRSDAVRYGGFDDGGLYETLARPPSQWAVPATQLHRDLVLPVWEWFSAYPERAVY